MTKPAADEYLIIATTNNIIYAGYLTIVSEYYTITDGCIVDVRAKCRETILRSDFLYRLAEYGPLAYCGVKQIQATTIPQPFYMIRCTAEATEAWLTARTMAPPL